MWASSSLRLCAVTVSQKVWACLGAQWQQEGKLVALVTVITLWKDPLASKSSPVTQRIAATSKFYTSAQLSPFSRCSGRHFIVDLGISILSCQMNGDCKKGSPMLHIVCAYYRKLNINLCSRVPIIYFHFRRLVICTRHSQCAKMIWFIVIQWVIVSIL